MRKLPPAWIAEARSLYARLGELHAERRDYAGRVANLDRQIEQAHVAIEHLAQTAELAASIQASGAPLRSVPAPAPAGEKWPEDETA